MGKTSYQVLSNVGSFIILRSGERVTFSLKVTVLTFLVKNGKMKLYFENARKNFESNLVFVRLVDVLVLESKGLYYG